MSHKTPRKYKDYTLKMCAAKIMYDIVLHGLSSGWSGDSEIVKELKFLLKNYNVHYVDDLYGEWALKSL